MSWNTKATEFVPGQFSLTKNPTQQPQNTKPAQPLDTKQNQTQQQSQPQPKITQPAQSWEDEDEGGDEDGEEEEFTPDPPPVQKVTQAPPEKKNNNGKT